MRGVVRVSNVKPNRSATRLSRAVQAAVYDVLPREWRVLPDGRAAAAVIARETVRQLLDEGFAITWQVGQGTDGVVKR